MTQLSFLVSPSCYLDALVASDDDATSYLASHCFICTATSRRRQSDTASCTCCCPIPSLPPSHGRHDVVPFQPQHFSSLLFHSVDTFCSAGSVSRSSMKAFANLSDIGDKTRDAAHSSLALQADDAPDAVAQGMSVHLSCSLAPATAVHRRHKRSQGVSTFYTSLCPNF